MIRITRIAISLLLLVQSIQLSAEQQVDPAGSPRPKVVEVAEAWVGLTPPTMAMNAGYFSLSNLSDNPIELVSVTSPAYGSIEIHQSQLLNGIASMRMLPTLTIQAHQQVQFESGGLHLMMRKPIVAMSLGDSAVVQLHFKNGTSVHVEMPVLKSKSRDSHHEQHNHHQHH
jgi:copper(I)-binding protein